MNELAVRTQEMELTQDKIELIKRVIANGATNDELELFIEVCNRMRLDPFAKQIYLVPRYDNNLGRNVYQPQVSIDAARLTAQRSHEYEGQSPIQWCGEDGVWTEVWLKKEHPVAAKATVYRKGFKEPLVAVATWDTYVQTYKDKTSGKYLPSGFWAKGGGALMLGKCAEMLALRKAFPMELSGAYIEEELDAAFEPAKFEKTARKTTRKALATVTREPPKLEAVKEIEPEIVEAEIVETETVTNIPVDAKEEKPGPWVQKLHIQAADFEAKTGLPGELVLDAAVLHVVGGNDPSTKAIKDRDQANKVARILNDLALDRGTVYAQAHIEGDKEWYTIEES